MVALFPALALAQPQSQPQPSSQEATLPKFDIFEYQVEGNSRLPDIDIERAVTPYLGEGKTLRDVDGARSALERAYRDAGYLTAVVSIPEQNVDGANVTLRVLEGEVERVRVKGAASHLPSSIKAQVAELTPGNVPYFPEMQRELAALNRSPDLKATPVMKAGKAPGTLEVQLDVEDQLPLHGSVEFTNRQSPNTTPQRLSASLRYDNLWQLGHSIGFTAQTSPQNHDEVQVLAGTYVVPVGNANDALALYAVRSRSKFATISGSPGLGVLGNSDIYGLRYAIPLRASADYSHSLLLGIDYKDVKQSVVLADSNELPTPVSYAPLVASYTGNWLGQGSATKLDATATLALRGLLGNRDAEFAAKRGGASASFLALRSGLQRTEDFGRWSLAGKLEFQLASGPLVSNEQYAAGGAESVRGYLEGEELGDDALRVAFELHTPKVALGDDTSLWRIHGLAFIEGARLHTQQAAYPQPTFRNLLSAGAGLRLAAPHGASLELDWAHAFDDAETTHAGDNRLHARFIWEF